MLVQEQLRAIEAAQRALLETVQGSQLLRLAQLMGIGVSSAWVLHFEFFGWRRFNNRREVGSCAGLTGSVYQSGEVCREQGISKAGNKRIRCLSVELAWSWLRHQPQTRLSQWFTERFARGGGACAAHWDCGAGAAAAGGFVALPGARGGAGGGAAESGVSAPGKPMMGM